uniref:TraC-like domain-containing protein n=1 Tax=candidate division WWE3 bacterium TaxID=2053526 RepID=A0A7C4XUV2_UNCKA
MELPEIKATTQDHLDMADIREDLVVLKTGDVAAIISTTAVNFALLSEMEQDALIAAFSMLLNSITYPIQIVIRSKRVDISNYITKVVKVEQGLTDPLLKRQVQSYRKFVQDLVKVNDVLAKRFFVVIPSRSTGFQERGSTAFDWVGKMFGTHTKRVKVDADQALKRAKPELLPKVDHVIGEFGRLGIKARQLTTQEIVELYFEIYNPSSAEAQRIRTDIGDYRTAIVEPAILEE